MVPTLWQHLFSLDHVMCTETQQRMTIEDVTMTADTFTLLMPQHLCFLHQMGLLEIIFARLK